MRAQKRFCFSFFQFYVDARKRFRENGCAPGPTRITREMGLFSRERVFLTDLPRSGDLRRVEQLKNMSKEIQMQSTKVRMRIILRKSMSSSQRMMSVGFKVEIHLHILDLYNKYTKDLRIYFL